jgi:branched-chain amino acid transport system permease protein
MILFSGVTSMLVSKVFFKVFEKLQDDYFAIATLGFAEMLVIGIASFNFLGGASGIDINIPFIQLSITGTKVYYSIITFFIFLVFLYTYLKKEKSFENIFVQAISENENGVMHLGLDTKRIKERVFSETGFWAGIVGGLMASYYTFISSDDFIFITTIPVLLFVVLGRYSVMKTLFMTTLIYIITEVTKTNFFSLINSDFGNILVDFQDLLYGLLLVVSVFFIYIFKTEKHG